MGRMKCLEITQGINNLKKNWFFSISAMAFFLLNPLMNIIYFIGLPIALIALLVFSSKVDSIWKYVRESHISIHIISLLTAIGISWDRQKSFYSDWSNSSIAQKIEKKMSVSIDIPAVLSVACAIASLFFLYACLVTFWKEMLKICSKEKVFEGITKAEWIVYGLLLISSICFMIFCFSQSQAFYGTEHTFDVIYTGDSPTLVKENVYLSLYHKSNDIRQPMFALFAAPFIGIPYLLGNLIGASQTLQAIFTNSVQIALLLSANFILAKVMDFKGIKRICFMVVAFCTYTQILFCLMMEQYVIAYFWLMFCIYFIAKKRPLYRIALWGAGGTLITSFVFMLFKSENSIFKRPKQWFVDTFKIGIDIIFALLLFGRFDVFAKFFYKTQALSNFAGGGVNIINRIQQYTEFVRNYFIKPHAGISTTAVDHVAWWLDDVTCISVVGVLILVVAVISALLNRNKRIGLISLGWCIYSIVMLVLLGWGTKENGLILYSLYYGWPFLVLLFLLVDKIESKLKTKYLLPIISICVSVALLVINIPGFLELLEYAITYYPV